jgi:hypothetical protein
MVVSMNNKLVYFFAIIFLALFWGGAIFIARTDSSYDMRKQCSLASFHPDITPEMRVKCRELLRHKL